MTITVRAAQDDTGSRDVTFTLDVKDLTAFLSDIQDNSRLPRNAADLKKNGNITFIADSWMWRVLSTTMGPKGTGRAGLTEGMEPNVLVIS
jgi:hypothetical protein